MLTTQKILVLEDDRASRDLVKAIVVKCGFNAVEFEAPAKLLEYLSDAKNHHGIAAVVTDMMMGDDDGLRAINEIRHIKELVELPVIVLSGVDPDLYGELLKKFNVHKFIQKPLNLPVLMETLAKFKTN